MRGLTDWFSIFRAGRWTSFDGRTRSFGHGDLDQVVETYDPEHPSPCVITHKEVYSPFAFGWVEKIRRRGDVLEGRCAAATLDPQFSNLVESGRLRNRSIQLKQDTEGKWRLGHVAFLGAEPPAVEGLSPIAFSAAGISFASEEDWDKVEQASRWADLVRILGKLAQRVLGQEESEELIPDWMVREADQQVGRAEEKAIQSEEGMVKQYSQEALDQAIERAKAEAKAEGKTEAMEFARQEQLDRRKTDIEARVGQLVSSGRITPAQSGALTEFANGLSLDVLEFTAEGQSEATQLNRLDFFFGLLDSSSPVLTPGRTLSGSPPAASPQSSDEIARGAREYQAQQRAKGIIISDIDAVRHVSAVSD